MDFSLKFGNFITKTIGGKKEYPAKLQAKYCASKPEAEPKL